MDIDIFFILKGLGAVSTMVADYPRKGSQPAHDPVLVRGVSQD
jgi:hypothetical protein